MVSGTIVKTDSKVIKEALKALGKDNFALIVHGSSFPAINGEDTGFGTYNSEAGHNLIAYAENYFNAIQLGPNGKTKSSDSSPYCGTIFSGNPLFIDLKQLTTAEWDSILPLSSFQNIVKNNPNADKGKTAYSYVSKTQLDALKEAWENFKKSKKYKKEFEDVKKEKAE